MFKPGKGKSLFFLLFLFSYSLSMAAAENSDSFYHVKSIRIIGNKKTRSTIILRELTFHVGDSLRNWKEHKEQSRRQLINLFIFNEVEISESDQEVLILVTERWYFWPIPELDYADRNFNQWWLTRDPKRLIYGLNLEWYNIRGRNETMVLSLISGYTKKAEINYKIPYFNKKQTWGLQFNAAYSSNKEVWYATEFDKVQFFKDRDRDLIKRKSTELTFSHRKKIFTYHHFYAGFRTVAIADTVATYEVNRRYLLNHARKQEEAYLGYQYVYDKRDYKGFPLKGQLLKSTLEWSDFLLTGKNLQAFQFKWAYSNYKPLGRDFFASFHAGARYFSLEAAPYNRVQALGYGKDYIRGYELNVIDGSHFVLGKTELKFRFLNRKYRFMPQVKNYEILPVSLFLSSFFDFGYVKNVYEKDRLYSSNLFPNSWQNGAGAGLNIVVFYDYAMRIEYAFNRYLKSKTYISFVASM